MQWIHYTPQWLRDVPQNLPITAPVCAEMQTLISTLHHQSVAEAAALSWLHFPPALLVLPVNPTALSSA